MMFSNCCAAFTRAQAPQNIAPVENDQIIAGVPAIPIEMLRSKSESRILQPSLTSSSLKDDTGGTPISCSARSLFEASAMRVALHQHSQVAQPDKQDNGIPRTFLRAYCQALRDGNIRWASEPAVAQLFADNVKLVTQDKQTIVGKAGVLRRFEKGVETLLKMAGKDAAAPEYEVTGPTFDANTSEHVVKCIIKRGSFKIGFTLAFILVEGKIVSMTNTRT